MEISVIGCGYVGLVTGLGFAELGNSVIFVDSDEFKLKLINALKPPIYEPGLEELMRRNGGRFYATNDYQEAISNSEISFICVGTPSKEDGSIDLSHVKASARQIGESLRNKDGYHVVVVKSTVLPGTTENVVRQIIEEMSGKKAFIDFGLAVNPEFLREGNAVEDFFNPDRIVIGIRDEKTREILENFILPLTVPSS